MQSLCYSIGGISWKVALKDLSFHHTIDGAFPALEKETPYGVLAELSSPKLLVSVPQHSPNDPIVVRSLDEFAHTISYIRGGSVFDCDKCKHKMVCLVKPTCERLFETA